jgi:hypothetical protein
MANFPSLTVPPSYPLEEELEDSTIRSPFEDGTQQSRLKYTRNRYTFVVNYDLLPTVDKNSLNTFVTDTVSKGADSFSWGHPVTGTTHTVTFAEIPRFSYIMNGYYKTSFKIREV